MVSENNSHPVKPPRKRKWKIVLLSIVVLLLVVRIFLPTIILKVVNNKLASLEEYYGHVEDIDLAIIRGAYQINGIRILKIAEGEMKNDTTPFFVCPKVEFSLQWNAIFKGSIVGEISVLKPTVNFAKGKHNDGEAKQDTADFQDVIRDLMPLTINHFTIKDGRIRYIDNYSTPRVDVALENLQVKADNLTNVNDSNEVLPAALKAKGEAYGGTFDLNVKFNALEKQPTFDLNARVDNVDMVKLNDFFKAYGKFDVEKGKFGLYTEFAAKEGAFRGYVKPLIKDLDVVKLDKEEGNFVQILWEGVVGGISEVFENQPKEQVATKLPIEGRFENPEAGLWTAINYVLRNAFVFALRPSIDQTINIGNVEEDAIPKETFLQKVFGKDSKKKEEKKEERKK